MYNLLELEVYTILIFSAIFLTDICTTILFVTYMYLIAALNPEMLISFPLIGFSISTTNICVCTVLLTFLFLQICIHLRKAFIFINKLFTLFKLIILNYLLVHDYNIKRFFCTRGLSKYFMVIINLVLIFMSHQVNGRSLFQVEQFMYYPCRMPDEALILKP